LLAPDLVRRSNRLRGRGLSLTAQLNLAIRLTNFQLQTDFCLIHAVNLSEISLDEVIKFIGKEKYHKLYRNVHC